MLRLHCDVLDQIYILRVDGALWRRTPSLELLDLSRHLSEFSRPTLRLRIDGVDTTFVPRWIGLRDLVEHRIELLEQRTGIEIMRREHVPALLEAICVAEAVEQSKLELQLGLRPANLTRVLNLMEDADLIRRVRLGRFNRVEATEHGRAERERHLEAESGKTLWVRAGRVARSRKADVPQPGSLFQRFFQRSHTDRKDPVTMRERVESVSDLDD